MSSGQQEGFILSTKLMRAFTKFKDTWAVKASGEKRERMGNVCSEMLDLISKEAKKVFTLFI